MNDFAFGNYLYDLRQKKGLTQNELGELLGVSGKAVSKWETGAAKPRTGMLMRLAAVYDLSVGELLSGGNVSDQNMKEESLPSDEKRANDSTGEADEKKRDTDTSLARDLAICMMRDRDKQGKLARIFFLVSLGLFILLFVFIAVVEGFSISDDILGPLGSMLILLSFFITVGFAITFSLLFRKKKRDIRLLFEASPVFSELLSSENTDSDHKKASMVYTKKQRIIWGVSSGFLLGAVMIQISRLIQEDPIPMPAQVFGIIVHFLALVGMLWVLIDRKRMDKRHDDGEDHKKM